jgi:hypothetical protein
MKSLGPQVDEKGVVLAVEKAGVAHVNIRESRILWTKVAVTNNVLVRSAECA